MSIFESIKKSIGFVDVMESVVLKAPVTGRIIPIEEVPDPVFSDKVVGDGLAIAPSEGLVVAPCDGVINKIFRSNHAFSIETPMGVELFVHIGLETVELEGKGFHRLAEEGQQVQAGDPVMKIDLPHLTSEAKSVITPVVIANMDDVVELEKASGTVSAGVDTLMTAYVHNPN